MPRIRYVGVGGWAEEKRDWKAERRLTDRGSNFHSSLINWTIPLKYILSTAIIVMMLSSLQFDWKVERKFPPSKMSLPEVFVGKWTHDDAHMFAWSFWKEPPHHAKEVISFGSVFNRFGHSVRFDGINILLEIPHIHIHIHIIHISTHSYLHSHLHLHLHHPHPHPHSRSNSYLGLATRGVQHVDDHFICKIKNDRPLANERRTREKWSVVRWCEMM
jgi:hypothetical protein